MYKFLISATTAIGALTACFFVFPESVHAQGNTLAFQIGVGQALSSPAKSDVGDTSIHAGLSLNIGNGSTLFVLPGTQGLDLDENYSSGHGGHINALGLTYANRISLIPSVAQGVTAHIVPYAGFGIGGFEDNIKTNVASSHVDVTRLNLGGKLIAGIRSGSGTLFELDYIISGSSDGIRTDTINFSVGHSF